MNLFGRSQTPTPVQPEAQEPPELTRFSVQTGLPPEAQTQSPDTAPAQPEKPLPRVKPGFRGIWANAEKCDTSDWNVYYFYYREIAQHGRKKFQRMKWIALAANLLFFLIVGIILYANYKLSRFQDFEAAMDYLGNTAFPFILLIAAVAMAAFLSLAPAVMVNQAFKIKERRHGFLTSRAKEQPLLLHLMEYTSCKGLVTGLVQSLVYTYGKLLLYMSPVLLTLVGAFFALAHKYSWFNEPDAANTALTVLVILLGVIVAVSFITMQSFCFRLDTLCFAVSFSFECAFFFSSIGSSNSFLGRPFLVLLAMWAACMVYFPLAAADTLEYGIGKHAKYIRFFLFGVIAFNFLWFVVFYTYSNSGLPETTSSPGYVNIGAMRRYTEYIVLPWLWILTGLFALVETSLSAASYRAKNVFRLHAQAAKDNAPAVRLLDPASPASVVPVIIMEIVLIALFILFAHDRGAISDLDLHSSVTTMLYIGVMVLSSAHFALFFLTFSRRHSHKERKPWLTHPNFNGLFFLFFAVFMIAWIFSGGILVIPLFSYVMAVMAVFILWEPVNAPDEVRPAEPPPADFGREPQ